MSERAMPAEAMRRADPLAAAGRRQQNARREINSACIDQIDQGYCFTKIEHFLEELKAILLEQHKMRCVRDQNAAFDRCMHQIAYHAISRRFSIASAVSARASRRSCYLRSARGWSAVQSAAAVRSRSGPRPNQ